MYKVIDEVLAADLEVGDLFEDVTEGLVVVLSKDDKGDTIVLDARDVYEDTVEVFLDPEKRIELLMEVDDDDS